MTTTQPSLTKEGWYLLAAQSGDSISTLIGNNSDSFTYWKKEDLDISDIYVPLYKDFSSNDPSVLLNSDEDQVTDISASQLQFGQTLGTVLDYNEYKANHFGLISNFNESFSENTGIWVYLKQRTLNPVLKLSITNTFDNIVANNNTVTYEQNSDARKQYPAIVDISTNSTRVTNDLSGLINGSSTTTTVDISSDVVIDLTVEKNLTFSYAPIFGTTTVLDNNTSQYPLRNNDNLYNNYTFNGDFLGGNFNYSTNSMDSSGTLTYTIVNTTPGLGDSSFNVIINIDVSDNIKPTIRLNQPLNDATPFLTFNDNNASGTLLGVDQLYYYGEDSRNKVYIRINQSRIKTQPNKDFHPNANLLDQQDMVLQDNLLTKTDISATIYDPKTDTDIDLTYTTGETRPGVYNMIYEGQDETGKKCKVDISFEIVDDIAPNFEITVQSSEKRLFQNIQESVSSDITTDTITQTDFDSSLFDASSVGKLLINTFENMETTLNDPNSESLSKNIYINYSDIVENDIILPVITTYSDFSGISNSINQQYFDLSNTITNTNSASTTSFEDTLKIKNYLDLLNDICNNVISSSNTNTIHINRTYSVADKINNQASSKNPNTKTINLPITIYDDTIQTVDVSYERVVIKNHTSVNSTSDPFGNRHPENTYIQGNILSNNNTIDSSIDIDQYNDIKFSLQFSKECRCFIDIYNNGTWIATPTVIQDNGNYSNNHEIILNHTHTNSVGTHTLYFRTYDKNNNSFKFKYNLKVIEIPPFTFRLISENNKQKLLLRSDLEDDTFDSLDPVCLVNFSIDVFPPVVSDTSFVDQSKIFSTNYGLTTSNYTKTIIKDVTINQGGSPVSLNKAKIGIEVKSSGEVTEIPNTLSDGYFYEIMNFPKLNEQVSGSTITSFTFNAIEYVKVIKFSNTEGQNAGILATQSRASTDIVQHVKYYDANNTLQSSS